MAGFERIVMATDFSSDCDAALHEAARLARESKGILYLVHAYDLPPAAAVPYVPAGGYFESVAAVRTAAEAATAGPACASGPEGRGRPPCRGPGASRPSDRRRGRPGAGRRDRDGNARTARRRAAAARQRCRPCRRDRALPGPDDPEPGTVRRRHRRLDGSVSPFAEPGPHSAPRPGLPGRRGSNPAGCR